jgi:hypothetical protein
MKPLLVRRFGLGLYESESRRLAELFDQGRVEAGSTVSLACLYPWASYAALFS